MYYREEWIDGWLYYKSTPSMEWEPFTKEMYRDRVKELMERTEIMITKVQEITKRVDNIINILEK